MMMILVMSAINRLMYSHTRIIRIAFSKLDMSSYHEASACFGVSFLAVVL